jgi:hypothetical protein
MTAATATKFDMAGTEGTHQYLVPVTTEQGRVGFRVLHGQVRVRVEPADPRAAGQLARHFPREDGWKQPEPWGQFRFSKVFPLNSREQAEAVIGEVERVIKALGTSGRRWNVRQAIFRWRRHLRQSVGVKDS